MTDRISLPPDTEGELAQLLGRLEEVLLQLQPYDEDDDPAPAGAGPDAVEALQRILGAVLTAERIPAVELFGADGSFELVPLRAIDVNSADLAIVGRAVAALGRALLTRDELVSDLLHQFSRDREQPSDLVASFARAHGLLDLAPDDDTATLADLITDAGAGTVVLRQEQEAAYQRFTARALAMFHQGDPLARFLYRGLDR